MLPFLLIGQLCALLAPRVLGPPSTQGPQSSQHSGSLVLPAPGSSVLPALGVPSPPSTWGPQSSLHPGSSVLPAPRVLSVLAPRVFGPPSTQGPLSRAFGSSRSHLPFGSVAVQTLAMLSRVAHGLQWLWVCGWMLWVCM